MSSEPHSRQYEVYWGKKAPTDKLRRVLTDREPAFQYERRNDKIKTTLGWGQRKLALELLEFLTLYSKDGDLVLYVGAAPGSNIIWLTRLFPNLNFDLYDPRDFDAGLRQLPNVRIFQEFFTDDTARAYSQVRNLNNEKVVLFISDIRTGSSGGGSLAEKIDFEKHVWDDMLSQQRWFDLMLPKRASLKFRLPYDLSSDGVGAEEKITEYLDGIIFIQPWIKQTSTETRLVPDEFGLRRLWSNKWYENNLFQHNIANRTYYYNHTVKAPGLDHCFDCASEVAIFQQYLRKQNTPPSDQAVSAMSQDLSYLLTRRRDGLATYKPRFNKAE